MYRLAVSLELFDNFLQLCNERKIEWRSMLVERWRFPFICAHQNRRCPGSLGNLQLWCALNLVV